VETCRDKTKNGGIWITSKKLSGARKRISTPMTRIHESSFEPAPFLAENVGLLPKGRVLDVAMGNGRNAIYLAQAGFEVEGVDMSPEAVNMVLESSQLPN